MATRKKKATASSAASLQSGLNEVVRQFMDNEPDVDSSEVYIIVSKAFQAGAGSVSVATTNAANKAADEAVYGDGVMLDGTRYRISADNELESNEYGYWNNVASSDVVNVMRKLIAAGK